MRRAHRPNSWRWPRSAWPIYGLPVSTTHVLSSGVAGTMAANRSGVQMETVRNLALAWVLTLPVCVFLGAATFAAGLYRPGDGAPLNAPPRARSSRRVLDRPPGDSRLAADLVL